MYLDTLSRYFPYIFLILPNTASDRLTADLAAKTTKRVVHKSTQWSNFYLWLSKLKLATYLQLYKITGTLSSSP